MFTNDEVTVTALQVLLLLLLLLMLLLLLLLLLHLAWRHMMWCTSHCSEDKDTRGLHKQVTCTTTDRRINIIMRLNLMLSNAI